MDNPLLLRLDGLKDRDLIRKDKVVRILDSCVISSGRSIEIYLNTGETLYTDISKLKSVLDEFTPLQQQAAILQKREARKLSVCTNDVVGELRDTLLAQLKEIRKNPSKEVIAQSKAVNDTINQFTNLAKTELEFKKLQAQLNKLI